MSRISLCMIVRDEEKRLEKCLRLARPHVDEIVIVDTGSTDATLEIAGRYADVIRSIEWPDSFAAARNVSMDAATGDYILILDADEYIEQPEHWEQVRRAAEEPGLLAAYCRVVNTVSTGVVRAETDMMPRLILNVPELRWHARIHNQIEDRILLYLKEHQEEYHLAHLACDIMHTGYDMTQDEARAKYERRIPLLMKQIEESEGDERTYFEFQLGTAYHVMRRRDEAGKVWDEMDFGRLNLANRFYALYLASAATLTEDGMMNVDKAYPRIDALLMADMEEPIALGVAGTVLACHGERDEDRERLRRGILLLAESYIVTATQRPVRFSLDPVPIKHDLIAAMTKIGHAKDAGLLARLGGIEAVKFVLAYQAALVEFDETVIDEVLHDAVSELPVSDA